MLIKVSHFILSSTELNQISHMIVLNYSIMNQSGLISSQAG